MKKRIAELAKLTLAGKMYVTPEKTEFDRMDIFLDEHERDVKRICEYIRNQRPLLTKYSALTGFFNFDGSCGIVGDIFHRGGHRNTGELDRYFYKKPIDNLSTMDAQHGTADFKQVLSVGIPGIIKKIEQSAASHTEPEKIIFLNHLKEIAETIIFWLKKCCEITLEFSETVTEPEYKHNLIKLAHALSNLTAAPPKTFLEAVLTIYVCFSFNPDSIGTLDRYLSDFYFNDLKQGILSKEEAYDYIQELLLMVQAATPFDCPYFARGGQSHFCIGGRDKNGHDCYNELSELIIESLIDLPTYIPEITLRWTNDLPKSTFRHILELERNDKNKRIAFTNDDKRIAAFTKICGFPYEEAVNFTLVGCNEPAMLGGMCASSSHANLAHAIETLLHHKKEALLKTKSFDECYALFKQLLYTDLDRIYDYDDLYNRKRGKDINYVSCLFSNGCIENGKSITQAGVNFAVSNVMFLGNVTVIDSLSVIKQFVFDEQIVTMEQLTNALSANWVGYEALRAEILKRGHFFGNDDDTSNYVAKKLYTDLYHYIKNKKTTYGYPALIGDHTGYMMHFKWFGEKTAATPDGRYYGDPLSYGLFQTNGKDRNGLTALMNSITKLDEHGISSATVTNFSLDNSYIMNPEVFEKTVDLLETYFKNGGIHFQLNYLEKEDLLKAKANPAQYPNLRVRVTGYSEFFSKLDAPIQDSVIARYETSDSGSSSHA